MFRGINTVSLDNKGRLAIPTKERAILEKIDNKLQLIVTIDLGSACLLLYPLVYWEEIEQKIVNLPSLNAASRTIQRLLIGHATEVSVDLQGRILLPMELRDSAKLGKKLVLVGQGNKIEIWDLISWKQHRDQWLSSDVITSNDLTTELQSLIL